MLNKAELYSLSVYGTRAGSIPAYAQFCSTYWRLVMPMFIVHETVYVCQETKYEAKSPEELASFLLGERGIVCKKIEQSLLEESTTNVSIGDFVIYDDEDNSYVYYDGLLQGDIE